MLIGSQRSFDDVHRVSAYCPKAALGYQTIHESGGRVAARFHLDVSASNGTTMEVVTIMLFCMFCGGVLVAVRATLSTV